MSFINFLSEKKLKTADCSTAIRKKITSYENLKKELDAAKVKAASETRPKVKAGLEKDIAESEEILNDMDMDILSSLEKWYPNREKYAKRGAHLQASRQGKKSEAQQQQQAQNSNDAISGSGSSAQSSNNNDDNGGSSSSSTDDSNSNSGEGEGQADGGQTPEQKKKKSSTVAWVLGTIGFLGLAAFGIAKFRDQ